MPRGNGTGPAGIGPMTGRRTGYCTGFAAPGYANQPFGCGIGLGRGVRRMRFAPPAPYWGSSDADYKPMDVKEALSIQAALLEKELKGIQERLKVLEED